MMGHDQEGQRTLRRIGIGFVVGFAVLFVYALYISGQSAGLTDVNAIECACIARNVARTGTFATDVIKPLSLARVPVLQNHPDLIYAPLHPLWEAAWYALMKSEKAIPWACGAWLFLGGVLLLVLGTKWFNIRVGALSAVLYVLNLTMLENAGGGTEAPMLGFLLLVLLALAKMYLGDPKKPIWKAVAFGAVAGILGLTKYAWGLSIIPVLIAVLYSTPSKSRLTATLAAFGAFILVLLPWMIRNALVVGDPFFTLQYAEGVMNTKSFPGNTLYRTFTTSYPSALMFFLTSPKEALDKLRSGLGVVYSIPISAPGLYLGALFVVSLFTTLGLRAFELARYVLYGAYVLCVLALLVVFPAPRLLVCLAAPATLFAVAFFDKILTSATEKMLDKARGRWTVAAFTLLAVLVCLPTILQLSGGRSKDSERLESVKDTARQVAALVDGPVVSDVPWPIAWYGDVKTIWLPKTVRDLNKCENIIGPAKWLLLTPMVYRSQETERTQDWVRMWGAAQQNDVLSQGYAVYRRLPDNWVLFQRVTVDASRGTAGAAGK